MIVIAIDGNPGSGKTTVSDELLRNENVKVVHLDLMFEKIKNAVLPNKVSQSFKRDTGEEITGINQQSHLYKILHSPTFNKLYKRIKELYISRELNNICLDSLLSGIKYLIIDGVESYKYDKICNFNYKVLVKSEAEVRLMRLKNRSSDFDEVNMAEATREIPYLESNYDFIIENNGTLDDLRDQTLKIGNTISQRSRLVRIREKIKNENNY